MKTLTEFSTVMLRRGAAARAAKTAEGVAPEAMAEAIATAITVPVERAQRMIEALDLVGDVEKVRLVRVFQGEKGPLGATSVGEFHYAIDRVAAGGGGGRRDRGGERGGDRGGRGGGGGGDRGGRGGGGGGGGGGMFGGERKEKPRGLGSLVAAASGVKKDTGEERARPGEIPRAGMGWVLTAAPHEARGERKGPGRGGPRRDRRGPGGPGGDRRPGGPGGDRGPRGPGGPGQGAPGADGQQAGPGGPGGDARGPGGDGRGPRRGRGGGGPGGPGGDRGPRGPRPEGDRGPRGPRPEGARGPRPEGQHAPVNTGAAEAVPPAAPAPAAPETAVESSTDKT